MKNLHELRNEVDELNIELIKLLEKRFDITKIMMNLKDEQGIQRTDKLREEEIVRELQKKSNLDEEFIENLMKLIFQEAKNA